MAHLSENPKEYMDLLLNKLFTKTLAQVEDAITTVLKLTGVTEEEFHDEAEELHEDLLDQLLVSLQSPFEPEKDLDQERVENIFRDVSLKAIQRLQQEDIITRLTQEDECVIVFDTLLSDFALRDHQLDCEEFKAQFRKHKLNESKRLQSHYKGISGQLIEINQKVIAKQQRS